jgi:hypothetical protein
MKTLHLTALAAILLTGTTFAGDHRYPLSPAYVAECGSCHVAYPPALMSAPAWATTMQELGKHFGSDASLDAKSQREISQWLQTQASTRDKHAITGKAPRLTESSWFRKEHRNLSLPAKTTSIAQCNACHTRAEQGDFGEASLKSSRR